MAINPFRQLTVIRNVSQDGRQVIDCYRLMYKKELWIKAYYHVKGQTSKKTIDEISLQKMDELIAMFKANTFRFTPTESNDKRQSSGFEDKCVQEVMRMILSSIYEPVFLLSSSQFQASIRPHTALFHIKKMGTGLTWCMKGKIKDTFSQFHHKIMIDLISEKIADRRFLLLIHHALKTRGVVQLQLRHSKQNLTLKGTISPLLVHIYLHAFDLWMEKQMKHFQTRVNMVNFKYVRSGDEFVIGMAGNRAQARQIKEHVQSFFLQKLGLVLQEEKTFITYLQNRVPFLGYEFRIFQKEKIKRSDKQNKIKFIEKQIETIQLEIPHRKIKQYALKNNYGNLDNFSITHRTRLLNKSEIDILKIYNKELRAIANYYRLAHNYHHLKQLFYIAESSFLKTIANKRRSTVRKVAKSLRKHKQGIFCLVQYDNAGSKTLHPFIRLKDIPKAKRTVN